MPPEGADAAEYLSSKYGLSPEQLAVNRARIAERGAAEGFTFGTGLHVWNTFDAHRLLFLAGVEGPPGAQRALKRALLKAYHGDGRNISAPDVLLELAAEAGLPAERAREVLERGEFADEVRQAERFWQEVGIHSVPAVIVDRKHLISGGQPSAVFEQALRQIAAESAAPQPLARRSAAGPLQWEPFTQHHQPALTRFGVSAPIKENPMKPLRSALLAFAAAALAATAPLAEPEYTTIKLEIDIAKPAKEVWAKVGGYCDISKWLNNVDCVITSGDGGMGTVRVLAGGRVTEILVAQTELSYGYTQPAREGQFYNLYHGFMEARPVTATTSKMLYTLMYDVSEQGGSSGEGCRHRAPARRCSKARSRT